MKMRSRTVFALLGFLVTACQGRGYDSTKRFSPEQLGQDFVLLRRALEVRPAIQDILSGSDPVMDFAAAQCSLPQMR